VDEFTQRRIENTRLYSDRGEEEEEEEEGGMGVGEESWHAIPFFEAP